MPCLCGVTVHITDTRGKNLQEWGVQYLRQHTEGRRVSAYVQSTPDVSFQVSLQPTIPFTEHIPPSGALGGGNVPTRKKTRRLTNGSEDHSTRQNHEKKINGTISPPVRSSSTPQSHSAPDFAFLASLYLDGRKTPERKIIVYTDPANEDFNAPDGKVAFKHRWVQSADGGMTEYAWVFKEKAIETVFDKMMIAGSPADVEDQDDDALIKAMESSGFDAQGKTEKESKVGQIVVELRRIVLGEKRIDPNYRPRHQEGQEETTDIGGAPRDITHATGLIYRNTLRFQPLRVVDYWPYEQNEGPYATFQFFYRSREQLQQFHFPGFPSLPKTTAAGKTRLLNSQLADLTPLSISQSLDKKTKNTQCDQDSYEARIKRGGFKPDDSQNYDFGSEYRDILSESPPILDKVNKSKKPPKYPAAPLPFLANKSSDTTKIDPLPLKTSPTTAEAALVAANSLASHPLQLEGQARQILNLGPPISTTAKPSSSVPPSTQFTKEQMADIANESNHLTPWRDAFPSDQAEDGDDEPATESDLETHADDDFDYAIDADEDEGYDALRSQFMQVRIRKRSRDASEDADDDDGEVGQGADARHLDGGGSHTVLKPTLTEGEHARGGGGKKMRMGRQKSVVDSGIDTRGSEEDGGGGGVAEKIIL